MPPPDIMNYSLRRVLCLWSFHNKYSLLVGVISAMVEKELGERNFGLDSLNPVEPRLQIDEEGPETSEDPTQSLR